MSSARSRKYINDYIARVSLAHRARENKQEQKAELDD